MTVQTQTKKNVGGQFLRNVVDYLGNEYGRFGIPINQDICVSDDTGQDESNRVVCMSYE